MTKEEAKDLIAMIEVKEPNELIVNSWWGSFVKDYKEALQMAIQSLEAWEKVKEEIESNMVSLDGLYNYQKGFYKGCNNVRKECIEIIDKHLAGVSE